MSEQETPKLPDEKKGRPSKAQLEQRETELESRQIEIDQREQDLSRREAEAFDRTLPDRTSIDEVVAQPEHSDHNPKSIRSPLEQGKRLADITQYMERHQDMQLLWVNDLQGDVQRWIDVGAEPVPLVSLAAKTFEGITDKVESKWVRSVGGDDGMGGHFWVYLMMIDPETYHEVRIAPQLERQELIRRAMKAGADGSGMEGGLKLPTYAPNLPTGDRGIDIQRETVAPPER